ncbi:hypothetical protein QBC37DRAFT_420615 [Rhypophila decipiens]|uniref:Uncharacterized protein n=1 Tax=Rhypophila decipiens TaxID=261697 RepID=A0AAN6Y9U7_9PEZI|nr:hypothetical protein QBC37DRAFT_420615 [Rhypophila decipiens]
MASSTPITCHCNENQALTHWVQTELRSTRHGRKRSLVLYGASGLGKTIWARSLGKHAYFTTPFRVGDLNTKSVQYAVFDRIKGGFYKGIPNWRFWFGCKDEIAVSDPWKPKRVIEWGKVCILVCEDDPRVGMKQVDVDYLSVNCVFVEVEDYVAHGVDEEGRVVIEEGMSAYGYCKFMA